MWLVMAATHRAPSLGAAVDSYASWPHGSALSIPCTCSHDRPWPGVERRSPRVAFWSRIVCIAWSSFRYWGNPAGGDECAGILDEFP